MKSFDYKRTQATIEAYGKTYTLPVKTTKFVKQLDDVLSAVRNPLKKIDIYEKVNIMKSTVELFIGKEETNRIYPNIDDIDVTEINAFVTALIDTVNKKEQEIIKNEYSPTSEIK